MILKESEISNYKITQFLGESYNQSSKMVVIGSPSLFLKKFESNNSDLLIIPENSKTNIERRPKGIIVYTSYSNKRVIVKIPYLEINEFQVEKGKERVQPYKFSLFGLLLWLQIPVRYARYVASYREYTVDPFKLFIKSNLYNLELESNGYNYESMMAFINKIQLAEDNP